MGSKLFFLALFQLALSMVLAVLITYTTFKVFRYFLVKRYKIELNNIAFAILSSSILFSVGYIVSGIIQPVLNVIRTLSEYSKTTAGLVLGSIKYSVLFVSVGFFIAFLVTSTGLYLFTMLTRNINEFEEISKDNKAVGIMTGVIIIVISIFVKDSAVLLLESLIPYPQFPVRT